MAVPCLSMLELYSDQCVNIRVQHHGATSAGFAAALRVLQGYLAGLVIPG